MLIRINFTGSLWRRGWKSWHEKNHFPPLNNANDRLWKRWAQPPPLQPSLFPHQCMMLTIHFQNTDILSGCWQYVLYHCMNSACVQHFSYHMLHSATDCVQTYFSLLKNEWLATNVKPKKWFTYEASIYLLEKLGKKSILFEAFLSTWCTKKI